MGSICTIPSSDSFQSMNGHGCGSLNLPKSQKNAQEDVSMRTVAQMMNAMRPLGQAASHLASTGNYTYSDVDRSQTSTSQYQYAQQYQQQAQYCDHHRAEMENGNAVRQDSSDLFYTLPDEEAQIEVRRAKLEGRTVSIRDGCLFIDYKFIGYLPPGFREF